MKYNKAKIILPILLLAISFSISVAYATDPLTPDQQPWIQLELPSIRELVAAMYKILLPLGIGLGIAFIIKAGYALKVSEGNPQKVQAAQEDLTSAIAGTIFIALSMTILKILIQVLIGADPY